jgi:hypothetical protein
MKIPARLGAACALAALLLGGWALASPQRPVADLQEDISPQQVHTWIHKHEGGQRSWVAVSGTGVCALGLYVYDQHGNCVARDDFAGLEVRDDLAASWRVPATGPYAIEVHNLGLVANTYDISVK